MYASMDGWTVKGLVRSLIRDGVSPERLVRDGKVLPKRELVDLYNDLEGENERRMFREHMAHISKGRFVTFTSPVMA
jgi:hypothetical protein